MKCFTSATGLAKGMGLALALLAVATAPARATLLSYWNFNNDAASFATTSPNTATFNTTAASYGEAYDTSTNRLGSNTAGLYSGSSAYLDLSFMIGQTATYGGSTGAYSFGVYSDSTVNRIASDTTAAGSLLGAGTSGQNVVLDFNLDSAGYQNLSFSFALRNQQPNNVRVRYSTNGGTSFTDITAFSTTTSGFQLQTVDLSSITALNNDSSFVIRVISSMTGGSVAFDNVQLTGTALAVPEPATWAYLTLAGGVLLWRGARGASRVRRA